MSTISFVAIAIISVFASIVYEFTVSVGSLPNKNLNYKTNVPVRYPAP